MCVAAAVAGAAAVGTIGSSVISSNAASDAANTQAGAANNATAAQLGMFNTVQGNLQPYMAQGNNALSGLSQFLSDPGNQLRDQSFKFDQSSDPLYNWMLQQGSSAITSQASALGGVNSGATLKSLSDYGQKTAEDAYQSDFNDWLTTLNAKMGIINSNFGRLYNTASLGENAAAGVGNAALQTGQSIGNNMIGAGNAQAAGTVGSANALNGGLTSLLNNPAFLNSFNGMGGGGAAGGYNFFTMPQGAADTSGFGALFGTSAGMGF